MSTATLPATRPAGRALIVGSTGCRTQPLDLMQRLGFACAQCDDPFAAMAELAQRPLAYRAVVLSLNSVYRPELAMIQAVKTRWSHVEVWLTHTDGRQVAMAEALRLGADGFLSDDGLHRSGGTQPDVIAPGGAGAPAPHAAAPQVAPPTYTAPGASAPEPVLTADELRALLQEPGSLPPRS